MNRTARTLGGLTLGLVALAGLAGPAYAADDATIDHSRVADGALNLLVSVPGDDAIDLSSVGVTINGDQVQASATSAESTDAIQRTTILAIDTSFSMRGERINAATQAATDYLDAVPSNVRVGIVTFDKVVAVVQKPTLDREASQAVIDGLELGDGTTLYQGVRRAVQATGADTGQRQVLLLSDGADTSGEELDPVLTALGKSDVRVDVVSLEQGTPREELRQIAEASDGSVVSADPAALREAFSDEAQQLARQVAVSAEVPTTLDSDDAQVRVTLDSGGIEHAASAFVTVRTEVALPTKPEVTVPEVAEDSNLAIPEPALYAALGAIAAGALGLIAALGMSRKQEPISVQQQVMAYGATAQRNRRQSPAETGGLADQARQVAQNVLSSNQGLEARIAARLEAAGMAIKASEWLLLHAGIAIIAGFLGLLITSGNILAMILFLFLGAVGPWVYLVIKQSRRLSAFQASLADTLQLMSGSLSAGLSLAQSMDTIVREGTEPITSEFKRAIVETRLGVPLEDALDGISQRMDSKDFKWVVMAIRIQREVGGNLAELLNTVAATLREREYLRRHVQALSAEGRLSCWILGGLPPGFFLYLVVTQPGYVEPLYTEPLGWLMLVVSVVMLTVGIFWMSKVAKVNV